MIKVLIPSNPEFKNYKKQLKKMYEENQEKITDTNSFQFIIRNTLFYTFIQDGTLIGAIYYFMDDDKLFLNGFAIRKNLSSNLYCLKLSTTWFLCPIYAEAQNRASAYCLLKCGFKRLRGNLFVLDR